MPNELHRYQEVEIRTATPTQLVVLLYDAAVANLQKAQQHITNRNIASRTACINKASAILTELQSGLSFENGGEIARSLDRLYRYIKNRIFEANSKQDAAPLTESIRLLSNLREAWAEVARRESLTHNLRGASANQALAGITPALPPRGEAAASISNLHLTA